MLYFRRSSVSEPVFKTVKVSCISCLLRNKAHQLTPVTPVFIVTWNRYVIIISKAFDSCYNLFGIDHNSRWQIRYLPAISVSLAVIPVYFPLAGPSTKRSIRSGVFILAMGKNVSIERKCLLSSPNCQFLDVLLCFAFEMRRWNVIKDNL